IPVRDGQFAGDPFGWLSAFSLLTGLGLVATYALLGCCWLVAKTEGDLSRLAEGLPLADFDGATLFGGDERGYSDYPALAR
ncbi:hypothetical protein PPH41_21020, partial [Burkholderia gladioli]|nr:hypothetical protein [Burkholderia gladioli]